MEHLNFYNSLHYDSASHPLYVPIPALFAGSVDFDLDRSSRIGRLFKVAFVDSRIA